eukprot:2165573-Prymnesium_polylepis.1
MQSHETGGVRLGLDACVCPARVLPLTLPQSRQPQHNLQSPPASWSTSAIFFAARSTMQVRGGIGGHRAG